MHETGTTLTCPTCQRKYIYDRSKGHRITMCNSCNASYRKRRIKQKAIEYKGGKCIICGYNKCSMSLTFHHVDPSEKDFSISGNHTRSWESLKKELDKCVLLCSNCHGEVHAGITKLPAIV